jgi:hypothetical protein
MSVEHPVTVTPVAMSIDIRPGTEPALLVASGELKT